MRIHKKDVPSIAQQVKGFREYRGLTRAQLSVLADLSYYTVVSIEQGKFQPTWGTLWRIMDALGYAIEFKDESS